MYIADVDKMNEALFSRGISAVFLSYVVLVLNVKRGLGMFHTLRAKSCISASDPKQGAAFHYILANFTLKGIVKNGFLHTHTHTRNRRRRAEDVNGSYLRQLCIWKVHQVSSML